MSAPRFRIVTRASSQGRANNEVWARYKGCDIHISRESNRHDWSITVTDQTGMYGYEGFWRDSARKSVREALIEAARGACLWKPIPAPAHPPGTSAPRMENL